MMKMIVHVVTAGAISLGLFGCGRKPAAPSEQALTLRPGAHQTNNVVRFYKDLPPDGLLVQVGRRTLTRSDFDERVSEWIDLQKSNVSQPLEPATLNRLEQSGRNYVFRNYMARAAMLEEAQARGVEPTENDLKDAGTMINQISRRLRLKRADFAKRFAGGEAAVTQRIRDEATLQAVIRDEFGSLFETTDKQAAALKAELERLRDEAVATNQFFSACLEQVRERLVSGALAVTNAPAAVQAGLPREVTFVGIVNCQAFNFDFPQARAAIEKLQPGEWSPVIALDETFDLYQLQGIEPDADKDLVVYTFSKFSAPRDIGWEVPDIEQLKKNIARERRTEKQAPWVRDLITKAGVLYPNGVQLFGQAQKPAAQTAPGVVMKKPDAGSPKHVHGQENVAE
jgi:hypothetical protein